LTILPVFRADQAKWPLQFFLQTHYRFCAKL